MNKVTSINKTLSGEMGGGSPTLLINSAMARSWLERDSKNRPTDKARVSQYARDMAEDIWDLNGETIKIAKNGDVLDGKHRLLGCIESGASFLSIVVFDLNLNSFDTIDNGKPRTLSDLLSIKEVTNYRTVSTAVRWVWLHDKEAITAYGRSGTHTPLNRDLLNYYLDQSAPAWNRACIAGLGSKKIVRVGLAAACHFLCQRKSVQKADEFFEKIKTGAELDQGSPALVLREKLLKDHLSVEKFPAGMIIGLILKGWALYDSGAKIKTLSLKEKEAFPYLSKKRAVRAAD